MDRLIKNKDCSDIQASPEFQTYDRKVDLLLRPTSYTHQRYTRIDYLNHISSYEKYAYSRQPRKLPNFLTIINPMDNYIWLFLIITVLAMLVALVTIDKFFSWWNVIIYEDTIYKSNMTFIKFLLCKYYQVSIPHTTLDTPLTNLTLPSLLPSSHLSLPSLPQSILASVPPTFRVFTLHPPHHLHYCPSIRLLTAS